MSAHWSPLSPPVSGYVCRSMVAFDFQGNAFQRPCGKCERCLALRKNDMTGRAAAEAMVADECIFYTLTYRDGEEGAFTWVKEDRAKFLRALRAHFFERARQEVGAPVRWRRKFAPDGVAWRDKINAARKLVRYIGIGEVGAKSTRRNHWHLMVFLSGGSGSASGIRSTPADKDGRPGREHIRIWPRGFVNVQVMPDDPALRVRAIQYVTKYMHKSVPKKGERPGTPVFRSLKPALGSVYIRQFAADHAEAGLVLPGKYWVPGSVFSRTGKPKLHGLNGVVRDEYVAAYRDAWVAKYGDDLRMPHSDFRARFDPDYARDRESPARRKGREFKTRASRDNRVIPRISKPNNCAGVLLVREGWEDFGAVRVLRNGVAVWMPVGDKPLVYLTSPTLRGVVGLDDDTHDQVEQFITDRRAGPEWAAYWRAVRESEPLEAVWHDYDQRVIKAKESAARKTAKLQRAADRKSRLAGSPTVVVPPVAPRLPKPPKFRRPAPVSVPDVPRWQSPQERFEEVESARFARVAALAAGLGKGQGLGDGSGKAVPEVAPITYMHRKLIMSGHLLPDGTPVRRIYRRPRDLARLLDREERESVEVRKMDDDKMDADKKSRGLWPATTRRKSSVTAEELEILAGMPVADQLAWHAARDAADTSGVSPADQVVTDRDFSDHEDLKKRHERLLRWARRAP